MAQKKPRWWLINKGAVRILAVPIAVGALLFVFRGYYVESLFENPSIFLGAVAVVIAIVVLVRIGQQYEWTGFGESVQPNRGDQEIQPRKTLWDWLQLLIVPLALVSISFLFTAQQDRRQQQVEEQRADDVALQAYLDQMSSLMIGQDSLRDSEEDSDVRTLARARTLTVLSRLDSNRKGQVVQFLSEARLVQGVQGRDPIIKLTDADLRYAPLRVAQLSGADLSGANLTGADLSDAYLSNTILEYAVLKGTNLRGAELEEANLSDAKLVNANLSYANLSNADLSGANLNAANLQGALMFRTDLAFAHLINANLSEASDPVCSIDFHSSETNLYKADLSDAALNGACLTGADLREADVTSQQLETARSLEDATMTNGQKYEDWLKD